MSRLYAIQWPDSGFGVRIPAKFLEHIGVGENDEVEIFCQEDRAVIRRAAAQRQDPGEDRREPEEK